GKTNLLATMRNAGQKPALCSAWLLGADCTLVLAAGPAAKSILEAEPEVGELVDRLEPVPGVTGPTLTLTNVDLWDDWTLVAVSASNAAGELLWLGPAQLAVYPFTHPDSRLRHYRPGRAVASHNQCARYANQPGQRKSHAVRSAAQPAR
ncbi:MAG: hypothetical protein NZ739_05340, partial [Verrucomicrobiae bacterium]|nr:hypothetical protein [Verrucomicrobiae bacterium]